MSTGAAILIAAITLVVLLLSGLYIHSMLLAVGIVGIMSLGKTALLSGLLSYTTFTTVATYSMTTIPLYVLCAQLILEAGVVEDLFNILYNTSHGKKGVLGTFCMILGAFLGAVCGSGTATSAALGQAAYPQLVKRGYKSDLAATVSASAGSLAGVIPPSVTIIVYGIATETPIGRMFVASLIPGILTTVVFIFCTLFFLRRDQKAGGEAEAFAPVHVERKSAVVSITVALVIAVTIFGGIYSGFMTATEAGAVSATVAFLCALALGKVTKDFLIRAARSTVNVTAMVMMIIIGAKIFGKFMSLSKISDAFVEALGPLMSYPKVILAILVAVYFVLFMLMEGTAVIVMTTPVLLPVMNAMGVDLLWFGIIVCFCCVIGQLTPPVGVCVYSVCGVAGIPVEGPFKLSMIFALVAAVVVGGLMILFPQVVTFLPSMML
ncbi:MAG: TRAP transporter large permease [Oscillibacter sp.]|nr:TRAP transporter large permease [uncultured Oscillibacter sp.]MCI8969904.1 TRAP transporter large permease [Oscillibacter sp.]